jgi:hypothetical protein
MEGVDRAMTRGRWAIIGALTVPAVVEWFGVRNPGKNYTLSELTRWAFRTDTTIGRFVFLTSVSAAVRWFIPHIIDKPEPKMSRFSG